MSESGKERAQRIAGRVEQFVRDIVIPYERDARRTTHGPTDELVQEMRARALVEQVFREIRAFRIYDGPTEVHKWALAKKIKRDHRDSSGAV
jgi:alkylation response protein AidB-like acyl-CoA dehydrogenase